MNARGHFQRGQFRQARFLGSSLGLCALLLAGACGGDDDGEDVSPCGEIAGNCLVAEAGDDATAIQELLLAAVPGDMVFFPAGRYPIDRGLSLDVDNVTLRGAGSGQLATDADISVLDFSTQSEGAQGLLVTSDNFTMEDLAIENTAGDGIKIEETKGVFLRRVRAEWTGGASEANGAYGLYPVQCEDVLIEGSIVRGASDAGIYVGQSTNIIVRDNLAEFNVAGIEIENSFDADVHDNVATQNTGGILVFNLPGLPVKNGTGTRIFDNDIVENNTVNFAPEGNIVAMVPQGTGFATIAGHGIEVFGNTFADNQTINTAMVSYLVTMLNYDDEEYDPYSHSIDIHDNSYSGGGTDPKQDLGEFLDLLLSPLLEEPKNLPDIAFDGLIEESKLGENGAPIAEFSVCVDGNGDADFAFLDGNNSFATPNLDAAPFACDRAPLPAVTIDGVDN